MVNQRWFRLSEVIAAIEVIGSHWSLLAGSFRFVAACYFVGLNDQGDQDNFSWLKFKPVQALIFLKF